MALFISLPPSLGLQIYPNIGDTVITVTAKEA
jgi:hypothetical protein